MLYELKQKIRHSRTCERFVDWLKHMPVFPSIYWGVCILKLAEPQLGQTKEDGQKYFTANQDMLEIPLWVASLNLGYKLYIRHHGADSLAETVLYAV